MPQLVRGHPALSNILLFARREFREGWAARSALSASLLRLIGEIRAARYEMVIDLHGQFRSALFAVASEAPVRIGFGRPIRRTASTFQGQLLKNIPKRGWAGAREGSWLAYTPPHPHSHARGPCSGSLPVGRRITLASTSDPPVFNLPVSPEAEARVASAARDAAPGRVSRLPSSCRGRCGRRSTGRPEGFAGVARELAAQGFAPIFIGAEGERALKRAIQAQAPGSART